MSSGLLAEHGPPGEFVRRPDVLFVPQRGARVSRWGDVRTKRPPRRSTGEKEHGRPHGHAEVGV